MKNLITAAIMMIGVLIAFASQSSAAPEDNNITPEAPVNPQPLQSYKPVICQVAKVVIENLKNTYNELPVFFGDGQDQAGSTYVVSMNNENGGFTILQFSPDKSTACIVGSGANGKFLKPTETKGTAIRYNINY